MGPVRGAKKKRKIDFSENEESADWWVEFSKGINGLLSPSIGPGKFESVFKISRKTFNYICSLVREDMSSKPCHFSFTNGKPLSLNDQVAVSLRRLSSGESLASVGDSFGLHHSTVSQVTWRFIESMETRGLLHLQWPSSDEEMSEIKSKFEKIQGFPNCCGAIDTTRITMCLPLADPTNKVWCDREKKHSMLLQAVVDPYMRFRDIVTGWPGKLSDSLVLKTSNFFKLCEKGKRLSGKTVVLPQELAIREYIVGDLGFPSLPWLVTPYNKGKGLTKTESEFNRQHFATQMVAKRALARLKETWKIIHGAMWRPDKQKLPRIILVCCILHNIIIDLDDEGQDEVCLYYNHDEGYRHQKCESVDITESDVRGKLSVYLAGKLSS